MMFILSKEVNYNDSKANKTTLEGEPSILKILASQLSERYNVTDMTDKADIDMGHFLAFSAFSHSICFFARYCNFKRLKL